MKKRVYFYIGNHEKSKSINSYLFLVKKKFNNYEIIPSIKIKKNSTNIVVEGFDKKQYLKITHNTGNNLKIILIVTEFLDNNFKTFNNFDKKKNIKYTIFYLMIRLYQILKLNDFIWFKNIYKKTNLKRTISKFKDFEYAKESIRLKKRFIYFEEILKISSLVYCTHNKIKNDLNKFYSIKSYLIFPLLKKIEKKKLNKKIKFSGFLTKYRMNVLKSLNIKFGRFNFFINNRDRNYSYSIHPKKNSSWIFSSPIRYIDAILFGEIPLTVGKFIDNYHNELSININVKNKKLIDFTEKKYSLDIKNINKKIVNYNKRIKNDDLESKIKLKNLI